MRCYQVDIEVITKPPQADPGATGFVGGCQHLSQSDWHQGDCDNDRDYAERSEKRRPGRTVWLGADLLSAMMTVVPPSHQTFLIEKEDIDLHASEPVTATLRA
jgi:hypothetical protein